MTDNLFSIDINNKEHIKLIRDYEKNNNLSNILSYITSDNSNSIITNEILCSKDKEGIKDICFIRAEKDKKSFFIDFINKNKDVKNKTLITYAEDYAFDTLGMEDVFIQTKNTNKSLIKILESKNYENLGEDKDTITFFKPRELEKEQGRVVHGNR